MAKGDSPRTLAEHQEALASKAASSVELVGVALSRARETGARLNLFLDLREERALAEAGESDARRARGGPRSPLDGVPVAIKDNLVQAGEPVRCASRILEGYVSPFTATAVARLERAGAVVIGRTNMDEFAMGSSTEHSIAGPARNPWNPEHTTGGSSGGSAAAVAAGIVPAALGSDTGGSIRQPASFCGVLGMKPTYGRVSRWGLVAFASSLDQIGPLVHTPEDAARLLAVISGHDPLDSTSIPEPPVDATSALGDDVSDMVLGLPREFFATEGADPEVLASVREAVAELEAAGVKTREVSLPHTRFAIATYYLIATAEASSNLARYDGVRYGLRLEGSGSLSDMYRHTRSEGFGEEVKRRILLGTYVLSAGYYDAYYRKAQEVRTLLRRDFEEALRGCDAIVAPTSPELAFRVGEKTGDPLRMYLSDIYTVSANLAGLPALSLPCGRVRALPVGLQVLGRPLDEVTPLRLAAAFQRRTDHHRARPDGEAA